MSSSTDTVIRPATAAGWNGRMEWSVLDWNAPSIRFYESLGAKPLSDWTMYRLTGEALRRVASSDA